MVEGILAMVPMLIGGLSLLSWGLSRLHTNRASLTLPSQQQAAKLAKDKDPWDESEESTGAVPPKQQTASGNNITMMHLGETTFTFLRLGPDRAMFGPHSVTLPDVGQQ